MSHQVLTLLPRKDGIFPSNLQYEPHKIKKMSVMKGYIEFNSQNDLSRPFDIRCDCMSNDEKLDTVFPEKQENSKTYTWHNPKAVGFPTKTGCTIGGVMFRVTDINGKVLNVDKLVLDILFE